LIAAVAQYPALICAGLTHRCASPIRAGFRIYKRTRYSGLALTLGRHHDPDQIGGVSRAELLHDVGAVILDRARTDSEMPPRFLV
jgi:hypothetical protein